MSAQWQGAGKRDTGAASESRKTQINKAGRVFWEILSVRSENVVMAMNYRLFFN
ncbi:MAG: hypothetical protein KBI28_08100 [Syntrophaceae bacterium]|nr:hypothetical protein [Syntrophaceae bacterium]